MTRHDLKSPLRFSILLAGITVASYASPLAFDPVASVPVSPGLSGSYWQIGSNPSNMANAGAYAASHTPNDTFSITEIDTANESDGGTTISVLLNSLGSFASGFSNGGGEPVSQAYSSFTGYLDVTAPGTWTIGTSSDDGSQILINGVQVVNNDGEHPPQTVTNQVTFNSAGLYLFEADYWENGGGTLIDVFADKAGGSNFTPLGGADFASAVASPEPGTWLMMLAGGIGLMSLRRRSFGR